jgi:uncharacterized protein YcbK (DUF882 family)
MRRFFLSGDGSLEIDNAHTGEKLRVRYREADGSYHREALARIERIFRSRGDGKAAPISLRLIELIDHLSDRERPRRLLLYSGYRSPEDNRAIVARGGGAARTSMHSAGLAADLGFAGVDLRGLWDRVRALACCGAGYYARSGFLHLDVGLPRFWEQTTSRVSEDLSADNARVFARTELDRYIADEDVEVRLYAVTLPPLRLARSAEVILEDGASGEVRILRAVEIHGGEPTEGEGCVETSGQDTILRIANPGKAPGRVRIRFHTCQPRLGRTPESIETNPIEVLAAPASGP